MWASFAALVAVGVFVVATATAAAGRGPGRQVEFVTGGRVDTPSGTFLGLAVTTFNAAGVPTGIRVSGECYQLYTNRRSTPRC